MDPYWKSALQEYASIRNQMELEYHLDPILPLTLDQKYTNMQSIRLNRLREWHLSRGVSPQESETRMKVLSMHEHEGEVIAHVEFRVKSTYMLRQRIHQEERMERENITLTKMKTGWVISKIAPVLQEKRSTPVDGIRFASPPIPSKPLLLNERVFPKTMTSARMIPYDRFKAQQYAETWWDIPNPEYIAFDVDCTNFVSQCLYAGNAPMHYTGKRESGWWYRGRKHQQEQWSFSWSVSHSLQLYLSTKRTSGLRADMVRSADQLTVGDVIIYDWDGDGRYQHSAIVTAIDASGMPLVNAHTANSRHRYWEYRDSYAWSDSTRYLFFHIADSF